jgi:hypothetical protein
MKEQKQYRKKLILTLSVLFLFFLLFR